MMQRIAIVIFSDPRSGSEEALGRVFNALGAAYDFKQRGADLQVLFQGAGTRWASELVNPDHPAHGLFAAVKDKIAGVSSGCADVFGARDGAVESGMELLTDNAVPNTSGLPSLARLTEAGYSILTF